MKRKIYKLLSSAKQGLFTLAFTVFSVAAYSQATYTLSYTGGAQTLALQAGSYYVETWGADGGGTTGANANAAVAKLGGKGGYANGTLTLAAASTVSIYVGGKGNTEGVNVLGGFNGGGNSGAGALVSGVCGSGGGASDIRVGGNAFTDRKIVAGGGGAAGYQECNGSANVISGGHGGGTVGGDPVVGSYSARIGHGGTQLAGGAGGTDATYVTGNQGSFGLGANGGAATVASGNGAGGGGGWYGGGSGSNGFYCAGGGGGGSSYIGGVTSGTTIMYGQTGFVTNPDVTGNGRVQITELCSVRIYASGSNSLNPAICSGNSLTLTTTAVSNYTWSNGNTTNTMIVVSPSSSQTYSVIGTSSAACQSAGLISVTVNSVLPVITITNTPNSICLGKTATLTAGGALSYTWAGGPGGVINGQSFLPTATANYTVTGQNGCGTTTSVTTITIAPLAVNAAASPSLSCSGNPVTMTVTSAVTGYTWSPGPITGSNVIVVPSANTVYTVTASDGTCSGIAMVTVNTKPNPTLSIVPSNTMVCEGAVVTMTASGAITYTWVSPSSNAPNISDNPTSVTLYQVSGTNSVNCVSSTSQLIFTQASPTVVVSADKIFVCSGAAVTMTASGATTYNWTNGPATAGNVVNPTSNSTYTVTGTTSPCSGTTAITINVLTASVLASATTPSICNGETTSLHASGATSYTWVGQTSFSPGNASVNPTVTTIYTVNANTTSGTLTCSSFTNITVTVFDNPTVTIISTKSVVCKSDPNIVLTGGGAVTYTWSTATVSTNISVHPQSTTTYSITGVDANGCMNTASKVIVVNACNGIAELTNKEKNISVYPNPSNGEFVVSSDSEISLKLINELGQEIRTIKLSEQNDYKVSVTNLANGVYFIVGQNNSDKISQKIVVAK